MVTVYEKFKQNWFWAVLLRVMDVLSYALMFFISARLMGASELGLLGLVASITALVDAFSQNGVETILVQKSGDIELHLGTAWSLQVIRGVFVCAFFYFMAPIMASFFHSMRLIVLLRFSGLIYFINSLVNIGLVYFVRHIDFRKRFYILFWPKIVYVVAVIVLAFLLRSVWAFFLGQFISAIAAVIVSYYMCAIRSRFDFKLTMVKEFFLAGKWLCVAYGIIFFLCRLDIFFVGKYFTKSDTGFYFMAAALAGFVAEHILSIVGELTLPIYSAHKDSPTAIQDIALTIISAGTIVSGFFCGFFLLFGHSFILVFLGQKWLPMESVLCALSIYFFCKFAGSHFGPIFTGVGRFDLQFKLPLIRLTILILLLFFLRPAKLEGVAYCMLSSVLFFDPILFYVVALRNNLKIMPIFLKCYIVPSINIITAVFALWLMRYFFPISIAADILFFLIYLFLYLKIAEYLAHYFFNDRNYLQTLRDNLKSFTFSRG
jgi:O-antigen/teichoic acid export membrane protein